jgi:uncharacterized protein (TIGR03032 family)
MNKKNTPPAPFSCTFSPNLPELLVQLGCSIVVSTFQAGKILLISPKNNEELVLLPRTFKKVMGIAVAEDRMAVATENEIIVLKNSPELALTYPKKPKTYDALYMPRATYYTGSVDIHDLHFGTNALWAVNTSFSCLCTIDDGYSFTPKWIPPFITALASEDRCHLNGLAMEDGEPRYITALGKSNSPAGWRENITTGGVLMDVQNNEVIAHGLAMPHTPRIWGDKLYLLLSAAQRLVCVNPQNGKYETVAEVPGFVRGMTKYGDYVFIGTSKLRKNSSTFKHLEIAENANETAITVIHLPTGAKVGKLTFLASVDELYDIQILPNVLRPNIMNTYGDVHDKSLLLPGNVFWATT